ncbi:alpha-glucosidase (family GH31 glycosyl hydrolase) [Algoriphagus ratkowskyi]|nr:alpha-glucosidase (family GH31 glycosyl hydrolase) [Algoriphagus ratkowskyi]
MCTRSGFIVLLLVVLMSLSLQAQQITLSDGNYHLRIDLEPLRLELLKNNGDVLVPAHSESALLFNDYEASSAKIINSSLKEVLLEVAFANKEHAHVTIKFEAGVVLVAIDSQSNQLHKTSVRFGGMDYAFGLGDAGGWNKELNLIGEVEKSYDLINNGGSNRWMSSFALFPKNNFAGVLFTPGKKSVTLSKENYSLNVEGKGSSSFYFFVGDMYEIYGKYKVVREANGFEDVLPKSRLFELGWESWDALGWNTNEESIKNILSKFLEAGYPIRWAVTGSGFWDKGGTTTSFGKWGEKFPTPDVLRQWLHGKDISWMIGQRTNFIPSGGPYYPSTAKRDKNLKVDSFYGNELSDFGVEQGFFVKDKDGKTLQFTSSIFPIVPSYLLNGENLEAAEWYFNHYRKWDVDGIKEDTMMDLDSLTGIFNHPFKNISEGGGLVMARNGEFVAPGTLLRINDTSVGERNSRIPINYFQYAFSGFPNVYSDVAGVYNMHNLSQLQANISHAWLLSLTAGMAVGAYPETWPLKEKLTLKKAIDFHYSLGPYLYSAAMKSFQSGFPYTLTPLPLIYPEDSAVYDLKAYQWMIGESVLAAPKLSTDQRDHLVYLPKGIWFDFETGERYEGATYLTLTDFDLNKAPIYVGGNGVIVLRETEQEQYAHIYPVGQKAVSYVHYFGSDTVSSTIQVSDLGGDKPVLRDLNDQKEIPYQLDSKTGKVIFLLKEGRNYAITF